ncbi:MAG: hypothetical protein M1831_000581 [Alyxoria varia]|nr:MAG: hypothetical protein M1831_000581 [Alyxoria varia]
MITQWPCFLFQVHEMSQRSGTRLAADRHGRWEPPTRHRDNVRQVSWGTQGRFYACNGTQIWETPQKQVPSAPLLDVFSIYYSHGHFYIVNYDATRFGVGDGGSQSSTNWMGWRIMRFSWDTHNQPSYVSFTGEKDNLATQRSDQAWVTKLLPSAYHAQPGTTTNHPQRGGMNGDLPLLLALIVFSIGREHADWALKNLFTEGKWTMHRERSGWVNMRGLVVKVWTWPQYSTIDSLRAFEAGRNGTIFR